MLYCSPQRITVPRQRRDGGARDDVDAACVAKCRARVTFVRGPTNVRPPDGNAESVVGYRAGAQPLLPFPLLLAHVVAAMQASGV